MKAKSRFMTLAIVAVLAGVVVTNALAVPPSMPTLPVGAYGDTLLDALVDVLTTIFPYAAIFTGVSLFVAAIASWIGRRNARGAVKG